MLKQLCELEHKISDKVCRFVCDNDTDINIIKESLFQFQKFIGSVEDIAKANKEAQEKAAQPPVPENTSEQPVPEVEQVPQIASPEDNQHA